MTPVEDVGAYRPAGFFSYAHLDDEEDVLLNLSSALQSEIHRELGNADFDLFVDKRSIGWGEEWRRRIDESLSASTVLIPIVSASFIQSDACRQEVMQFLEVERKLDRTDLILPIYWRESDDFTSGTSQVAQILREHQYVELFDLRFDLRSPESRREIARLSRRVGTVIRQLAPKERQAQEKVWSALALSIRSLVSEAVWFSTFHDVLSVESASDELILVAPNDHMRDRIMTRYFPLLRDELDEMSLESTTLKIESAGPLNVDNIEASARYPSAQTRVLQPHDLADSSGLNPRYSFETLVKGASNQFALAAALRVAETPGRSYNPLFIYGASGLGKTHLLHAIGHYVHHHYQHDVVRYVSTETFLNEYVDGIRTNTVANFKRRYRDIDVLLIDDIQFLEGKEGLQEEFFHTFNSLHGANKQIVIASDRMPDAIPTLEESLRGRFKSGLITDIQPPDIETRLAILRNKAERDESRVPADVLEFIAAHITNNVRELEGALIRVTAYASLERVPISMHLAETLLRDLLTDGVRSKRTDEDLLAEMAIILGQSVDALRGKSQQRAVVVSRQIAMYVFRDLTDLSYPAIARLFGGRDHTTVIRAVEKVQRLMSEHKQVYDQVTDLILRLKQT